MSYKPRLKLFALACCAVAASQARAQQMVEVNTCGQYVPDNTVGYLSADLDCTGYTGDVPDVYDEGTAVSLGAKSSLDLRGFTLTAGEHGVLCNNLWCETPGCNHYSKWCAVFGGTVIGTKGRCIAGNNLIVHDVTVSGCDIGIYGYRKLSLADASVNDTVVGVHSGRLKATNATVTNNGQIGVAADNTSYGRAVMFNSNVTNNGGDSFCTGNPGSCGDIASNRRPRLSSTTCGTSIVPTSLNPDGTWFVCAND